MYPILTSEQMRALDKHAIEELGIPSIVLMENAALAALAAIEDRFDDVEDLYVAVICGPGNNGGDGYALARHLHLRGADVEIISVIDPQKLQGDALTNSKICAALDIPLILLENEQDEFAFHDYDLIIDAIFGTGARREPNAMIEGLIEAINVADVPVLSIDLPSGVDGSTGEIFGRAVEATFTVALEHAKIGHLFPPGRDVCGDLIVAPISIPEPTDDRIEIEYMLPQDEDVADLLPPRPRAAHKGDFGKLLIIAGSRGMSGAARLVAMAALRSGIGLVRVACPESIRAEIAGSIPEAVTIGLPETEQGGIADSASETLKNYLDWPDVIAVGPGLKTEEETALFLKHIFSIFRATKFVIDADALNLIAVAELEKNIPPHSILTPHPGEFKRLTNSSPQSSDFRSASLAAQTARAGITSPPEFLPRAGSPDPAGTTFHDSITALKNYSTTNNLTVLLKGSPSVTASDGQMIVNPTGNPGLATGGTGDALTGIISSLWAQGLSAMDAAWVGSYLHGRAADIAAESTGEISLIATDVIRHLPAAIKSVLPSSPNGAKSEAPHGYARKSWS